MAAYGVAIPSVAPATANDVVTITSAEDRSLAIRSFLLAGLGSASSANAYRIARPSTLGITPVAITPAPLNPSDAAAGFTAASGWTTQPVLPTGSVYAFGVNANGALFRWVASPGEEFIVMGGANVNTGQLSWRPTVAGTGNVIGVVVVNEL